MKFSLTSPAFEHGQPIPRRYTCEGDDISPPLEWAGLPATGLPEGAGGENLPKGCREGLNDWKKSGYGGPCPPVGQRGVVRGKPPENRDGRARNFYAPALRSCAPISQQIGREMQSEPGCSTLPDGTTMKKKPSKKRRRKARTPAHQEAVYVCDSCGEEIVVPVDISAGTHQDYVEDCPVCCHPMSLHVEIGDDGEAHVEGEHE